jgi:hypothetical protein
VVGRVLPAEVDDAGVVLEATGVVEDATGVLEVGADVVDVVAVLLLQPAITRTTVSSKAEMTIKDLVFTLNAPSLFIVVFSLIRSAELLVF